MTPAVPEEPGKKTGLMRGARDFIENTFASLKGKDMNVAVEEFTSEMTLVAEGLSEDLSALRREVEELSAQMTLEEERSARLERARQEEAEQAQKQLAALERRLEALEKAAKAADKKPKKAGLMEILRQATWMVGLLCSAWVVVTLLKLIGG